MSSVDRKNNLLKCMEFIVEIDKLKNIFRRSKLIFDNRYENDAEHSWHICVMAYTLLPFFEQNGELPDVSKSVKMLLIHDIVEVYAGDTYCYDEAAGIDKYEREVKSANKIFGMLPKHIGDNFKQLWVEFDEEKTKEAVFASSMDKLQPLILNYYNNGQPWIDNNIKKSQVLKRMDTIINKMPSEEIKRYVLDLINDAVEKGYLINE